MPNVLSRRGAAEEAASADGAPGERSSWPTAHLVVLGVLVGICVVRCMFWVLTTQVPFGDEPAHISVVQWLATGRGLPITGKDHVPAATLQLAKSSPVQPWGAIPVPPDPKQNWYMLGQQYQGFTGPLYHLIMIPVYWIGTALGGIVAALYAIRLATVALIAATVPLIYLLAREVFPRRQAVWLLAPAVFVSLQVINATAIVEPDSLTPLAGATAVYLTLRSRRDLRLRRAAIAGVAIGAAVLAKPSATSIFPAIVLAVGWYVVRMRPPWKVVLRWAAGAGIGAFVVVLPWVAFNLHAYGAITGAKQQAALVVPIIGRMPPGLTGMRTLIRSVLLTLFVAPQADLTTTHSLYRFWELIGWCSVGLGFVGAGLARSRQEIASVVWLAVSLPVGLVVLAAAELHAAGPGAALQARHLDPVVPLFCVLVAYGAVAVIGSRAGASLLLAALVTTSFLEIRYDRLMVRQIYTAGVIGSAAAVVYQTYADGRTLAPGVQVSAPCAPTTVMLEAGGSPSTVRFNGQAPLSQVQKDEWSIFGLRAVPPGPLRITFSPPTPIGTASRVRSSQILPLQGKTPAVQVYCRVNDPMERQFQANYRPDHPFPMTLGALTSWPLAESIIEAVMAAAVAVGLFAGSARGGGAADPPRRNASERDGGP